LLADRLNSLILSKKSLEEMLAAILASHLASENMRNGHLYDMFADIFCGNRDAVACAVDDLTAIVERDPACPDLLHAALNLKGFHALQTYRAANSLWMRGRQQLAYVISHLATLKFAVDIHPAACIGSGVMLDHGTGIVIGETAVVESDVSIFQNVTLGGTGKERGDRHPKVRSGALIGAGAQVLGNIEIGSMSRIAAGSVVLKDVPPRCTAAGVPARIVKWHGVEHFPAFDMHQGI
jgi:serine O-acetyltransferase